MLLTELKLGKKTEYLAYNETLPLVLWDEFQLKPDVKRALKRIAQEFIEALKVPAEQVVDIILTGSCCNYNWTKYSDIDLHIILDYDMICDDCGAFDFDDCMKAKKSLWNDRHEITIYGMEVELYAQDKTDTITGNAGVYSLMKDSWIRKPRKHEDVKYDERTIFNKAEAIMMLIDSVIDDSADDPDTIEKIKDKIKNMRKAGLQKHGEFSLENLVFKVLRNSGYIEKLHDFSAEIKDKNLSLE